MSSLGNCFEGTKNTVVLKYNYALAFQYIPIYLKKWQNREFDIDFGNDFTRLAELDPDWLPLVEATEVMRTDDGDLTAYVVLPPSNGCPAEVAKAMFVCDNKSRQFVYFTLEYSFGQFAICSANAEGMHSFIDGCNDPSQFEGYVRNVAKEKLIH